MRNKSTILLGLAICMALSCREDSGLAGAQKTQIAITSPQPNAEVVMDTVVEGTVRGLSSNARVVVLLHPFKTNLWWVQPLPSPPGSAGTWRAQCYFGTATQGIGEQYEVVAIVTDGRLQEGQQFKDIPKAITRSEIITVRRK